MRTFALILFECAERANSSAAYTRCHAVGYGLVCFSITMLWSMASDTASNIANAVLNIRKDVRHWTNVEGPVATPS